MVLGITSLSFPSYAWVVRFEAPVCYDQDMILNNSCLRSREKKVVPPKKGTTNIHFLFYCENLWQNDAKTVTLFLLSECY